MQWARQIQRRVATCGKFEAAAHVSRQGWRCGIRYLILHELLAPVTKVKTFAPSPDSWNTAAFFYRRQHVRSPHRYAVPLRCRRSLPAAQLRGMHRAVTYLEWLHSFSRVCRTPGIKSRHRPQLPRCKPARLGRTNCRKCLTKWALATAVHSICQIVRQAGQFQYQRIMCSRRFYVCTYATP